MIYIQQLILAFLGAAGFSLIFGVCDQLILTASFGGVVCWGTYLAVTHGLSLGIFTGAFLAAAFTEAYAVRMAKKRKTPAIVLFTSGIVPLIPGSGLYYMMRFVVSRDWIQARSYGYDTLLYALGIASGMSAVCAVREMWSRLRKKYVAESAP